MPKKIIIAAIIFVLLPAAGHAVMPIPARIGGTVTVDGALLSQAGAESYKFVVTLSNGDPIVPSAQSTGLNGSNYYIVDIPVYETTDQPGGANPGDTLVIHVYDGGIELTVTSPSGGQFLCGAGGRIEQMNISAQTAKKDPAADIAVPASAYEGGRN